MKTQAEKQGRLTYYMHDGPTTFRFELSGLLTEDGARVLAQDWLTAASVNNHKALIVDLSFVTGMDAAGRGLMLRWHDLGAQFVAISSKGRSLVESITGAPVQVAAPTHEAYRPWMSLRAVAPLIVLLALLLPARVLAAHSAESSSVVKVGSSQGLAFGRYIASVEQNRPFSESGNVAVEIEASLPGMEKWGRLVAIRSASGAEHDRYMVVSIEGDSTIKQQVIARYLTAEQQAEALPAASVAVTPENYKFRYAGSIGTASSVVYVFNIKPKKKREGLLDGQLWIDAVTGMAVHQSGHPVKKPSVFVRRIEITRDVSFSEGGIASMRTTHVAVDTRLVGRAELTITERPLPLSEGAAFIEESRAQVSNQGGRQ
jgi:hypothetical protein